ncbi:hypothetical protein TcWFU_002327 [Taenia crassiceps]|uniref:Uncharacterized protein n=1 Tax=Taenia crassiceps TaxID=6207 RepID=A0ABR4QK09_9CEST
MMMMMMITTLQCRSERSTWPASSFSQPNMSFASHAFEGAFGPTVTGASSHFHCIQGSALFVHCALKGEMQHLRTTQEWTMLYKGGNSVEAADMVKSPKWRFSKPWSRVIIQCIIDAPITTSNILHE